MPPLGIDALGGIARTERVPTEASATGSTTGHMAFTSEMDHLNPNVPILFASQHLSILSKMLGTEYRERRAHPEGTSG